MQQEKNKIFREFSFDKQEYYVKIPTLNILREAKYSYAKSFTESIKKGFLTKKKMEITLAQSDPEILKEYANRRVEILKSMVETEEQMDKTVVPEEIEYLAEVMSIYRNTLLQEDMTISALFSNTADQLAEDDKVNFLVFSLIYRKDGEQVWKTYIDLLEEVDSVFIETCKYQILCLDYKLNPDWEKDLPESKAKVIAQGIRDKVKEEELLQKQQEEKEKETILPEQEKKTNLIEKDLKKKGSRKRKIKETQ